MQVLADVYSTVENYSLFIQIKRKLEYKAEILKRRHNFEIPPEQFTNQSRH